MSFRSTQCESRNYGREITVIQSQNKVDFIRQVFEVLELGWLIIVLQME